MTVSGLSFGNDIIASKILSLGFENGTLGQISVDKGKYNSGFFLQDYSNLNMDSITVTDITCFELFSLDGEVAECKNIRVTKSDGTNPLSGILSAMWHSNGQIFLSDSNFSSIVNYSYGYFHSGNIEFDNVVLRSFNDIEHIFNVAQNDFLFHTNFFRVKNSDFSLMYATKNIFSVSTPHVEISNSKFTSLMTDSFLYIVVTGVSNVSFDFCTFLELATNCIVYGDSIVDKSVISASNSAFLNTTLPPNGAIETSNPIPTLFIIQSVAPDNTMILSNNTFQFNEGK